MSGGHGRRAASGHGDSREDRRRPPHTLTHIHVPAKLSEVRDVNNMWCVCVCVGCPCLATRRASPAVHQHGYMSKPANPCQNTYPLKTLGSNNTSQRLVLSAQMKRKNTIHSHRGAAAATKGYCTFAFVLWQKRKLQQPRCGVRVEW